MNVKLIKIDQTNLWLAPQVKKLGRVFGVYVFDSDQKSKFAGKDSYELLFVRSESEVKTEAKKTKMYLLDGDLITSLSDYRSCEEIDGLDALPDLDAIPVGEGGIISVQHLSDLYEQEGITEDESKLEQIRHRFLSDDDVFHRFVSALSERIYCLEHFDPPKYGGIRPQIIARVPLEVLEYVGSNLDRLARLPVFELRHQLEIRWAG
jgi:hypothetical protein